MPSKVIQMANMCARQQFTDAIANYLMNFIFHTVESLARRRKNIAMNDIATADKLPYYDADGIFLFCASDSPSFQSYFCKKCGQYESTSDLFNQKAFRISCRGQGYMSCHELNYTNIDCECGNCECCKWTLNPSM